jgi:hypothetical protein
MTKLLAEATVLQKELGLDETHLRTIEQAMRNYAASAVNASIPLIERREKPEMIRKFMEPIGLTYDGKVKSFK